MIGFFTDIACPFGSAFTLINNGRAEQELDRLLSVSVTVKAHFPGVVIATVGSDSFSSPPVYSSPTCGVSFFCYLFFRCDEMRQKMYQKIK